MNKEIEMKAKYRHTFDRIYIDNRWKLPRITRSDNWIIFGVYKWWFSRSEYEYQIGLFGFTIRIWMNRTLKQVEK